MPKSHHQHLSEERAAASHLLKSVKPSERDKISIYLDDRQNTVLLVKRNLVKKRVTQLLAEGKHIRQIL